MVFKNNRYRKKREKKWSNPIQADDFEEGTMRKRKRGMRNGKLIFQIIKILRVVRYYFMNRVADLLAHCFAIFKF